MFGDLMGMMGKIKETQKKVEETKARLNSVLLDETSADNQIKVTITANRTLKDIQINEALLNDKDALEDYLVLTLNKAIERATKVHETEIAAVAKDGMPDIPGLDMFK
ncbi:YbaB/EbfC family nucleoid-associated protein [Bizionia sediminis]|uniref:Nucleoid-associated protein ACFSQP_03065 n=1 Tax=Bizionia sediminis TaxID=1737064 RepID=A0ABW5KQ96_9FLAO